MPKRVSRVTVRIACAQIVARPISRAHEALADIVAAIGAAGAVSADFLVLPECAYPGYVLLSRDPYGGRDIPSASQALATAGKAARRARTNVIVGIARAGADGRLRNEAVLIDRNGDVVGTYAKSHLWNFDRRWFKPGDTLPVFETDRGRIGIMICADGRVPEIARTLTKRGAWLIADPTAWVGNGRDYDEIRNPQVEFVMRTRAFENGVVIAAADKCGSESGAVHYAGRSMVVGPDGAVLAQAPAAGSAFIVTDVDAHGLRPKTAVIVLAQARRLRTPVRKPAPARTARVHATLGVYQSLRRSSGSAARARALAALRAQGATVVIDTAARATRLRAGLHALRGLRCAVIEDQDMLAPEPARAAALDGADLIVWAQPPRSDLAMHVARTRAFENRVFVIACCSAESGDPACLIGPDGAILVKALAGIANGFICDIDASRAREKCVVWGTDAFADRTPAAYDLFV